MVCVCVCEEVAGDGVVQEGVRPSNNGGRAAPCRARGVRPKHKSGAQGREGSHGAGGGRPSVPVVLGLARRPLTLTHTHPRYDDLLLRGGARPPARGGGGGGGS